MVQQTMRKGLANEIKKPTWTLFLCRFLNSQNTNKPNRLIHIEFSVKQIPSF